MVVAQRYAAVENAAALGVSGGRQNCSAAARWDVLSAAVAAGQELEHGVYVEDDGETAKEASVVNVLDHVVDALLVGILVADPEVPP